MDVIVVEREVWNELLSTLYQLCRTIPPLAHHKDGQKWISTEQASQIFGLSRRKLEALRDEGLLETAKMGRKIYYNIESLKSLIKSVEIAGQTQITEEEIQ